MILLKVMLKTYFLRMSQCARDSFWWVIDDFYKVNRKPASVDGIHVGIIAAEHWIPTVDVDFSYYCLTVLQSCHFCFFHGHDLRVSIPDLLFTKDTLPVEVYNSLNLWLIPSLSHSLCCVLVFATPWTITHQAPLSLEFFKHEYQSGLPFPVPRDLPDPGITPISLASPTLTGRFFTTSATWEEFL